MRKFLTKAAAISLLLLVFVDLSIPSLCTAESIPQPGPSEASGWRTASTDPVSPVQVPAGEEDCFCCCSHIRPQARVNVSMQLALLPEWNASIDLTVPTVVTHGFFHPPRA